MPRRFGNQRARVVGIGAVFITVVVLALPNTPSPAGQGGAAGQVPQATGPTVIKVENGGLLFTDNPAGVSGVDCGYSLPIGTRVLWFFGDVFLLHPTDPAGRYVGGVSNAALTVPNTGHAGLRQYRFVTDPRTGLARQVIPNAPGEGTEVRIWPLGGWYDHLSRKAYVYYGRVRTTGGGGPFDFRVEGHGLAFADTDHLDKRDFVRMGMGTDAELWWKPPGALYGCAVVAGMPRQESWLYVVGVEDRGAAKIAKLARVRKQAITDRSAYEYLAEAGSDPRWSAREEDAVEVPGLSDFPTELTVSYNKFLGGYLAVHSVGITDRIRLSLATDPWGPYIQIAEIGAPHRAFEKAFCYAGKEHPELAEQSGRVIYVTYVDSQRYWLRLLRVTLGK